jgi:molybdopterin molybdotransferase
MARSSQDCFGSGEAPLRLEAALARLLARIEPVTEVERLPLEQALDRILAETVVAAMDVPPTANAAVDGYAVYFADLAPAGETRLPVAGRAAAGHPFADSLPRGQALRIFTGAPLPPGPHGPGPDTVVMQEDCRPDGGAVVLPGAVARGANRRLPGEDAKAGSTVLAAGLRLRPQEIGLAAAVGRSELAVRRRLRVALFSTGDELAEPGAPLGAVSIYDANRSSLAALLRQTGAAVSDLGILPDRPDVIRLGLQVAARDHDLLVTSGGVSVGEEDHVKAAMQSLGRLEFWRLAVKPGRPIAIGRIEAGARSVPFVGLPGNPGAMMVTYLRVARPMVLGLMGARDLAPEIFPVRAGFAYRKKKDRREWLRARLARSGEGMVVAMRSPGEGSAMLSSFVAADGLVELPEELTELEPGAMVDFLPFSGMR